ncbi:hypothetical protein M406DRAFT_350110 [Cryphonectria parasitica EP155]|uniref:Casein kinase II beta 2 subunit n=1 Tax=Cryphonectria parasitica (strain ATCC 38755 / EP155) TaxID=660469 RepID=A0A9P4YAF0_CRYP1|nr:uncharacterized protein M406DRAFT_350110 [Cryphonectria parasitica EP155]KAF3769227.1 hypothetical protein M406DRAFT_350110 [Cryphonectria parasitica EP155]
MAPAGGVLAPVVMRALRQVAASTAKVSKVIQGKLSQPLGREVQHIAVRATGSARQPIHPAAFLRQSKRGARWSSTTSYNRLNAAVRRFISTARGDATHFAPIIDRTAFAKTTVGRAFAQFPGRAPFSHTLRPNLTGGTLPRTAGGYAMPGSGRLGGQRYFSHTPASQAQVVQNVSQAMRAFWLSGQRAHFDGFGPNGEKSYKSVSVLHDSAATKLASMPRFVPGSFIDFHISPTVTALGPLSAAATVAAASSFEARLKSGASTLNTDGFLDVLSTDFARQLKDLAAVMNDLKRLVALGDLPIALEKNNTLRVRFPGLDADTVERLCDDVGIQRGVVRQDVDFDSSYGSPMALCFPLAPGAGDDQETFTSPGGSVRSHLSELSSVEEDEAFFDQYIEENPWLSAPPLEVLSEEGYESISPPLPSSAEHVSEDFDGVEGIYRFLEECDQLTSRPRF